MPRRPSPKNRPSSFLNDLDIYSVIFTGFYPRIHDKKLTPRKWLENYVGTYLERDIRRLVNVENLMVFENFLKVCAAHSGRLTNFAAISNAVGISQPTVKKWLSLLETSGVVFLLRPYHRNFSKRIVKTSKLYFVDTGLLCFLLSIRSPQELIGHPQWGSIFETFVISEFYKKMCHVAEEPPLYFWRDQTGNEVDLLVELGQEVLPIEIKASQTYTKDFAAALKKWTTLKGNTATKGYILYRGEEVVGKTSDFPAVPWWMF